MEVLLFIVLAVGIISMALLCIMMVIILKRNQNSAYEISREMARQQRDLRQEIGAQTQSSVSAMGGMLENRLQGFSASNERQLEAIREAVEKRLEYLQADNTRQLAEMRNTVDERLNKTLEEKMNRSFSLVSERLEQVYKGLGEMQNLAVGVGDLKKVLSNVKTRGMLGEIQLGSILAEILSPSQYEENAATKRNSRNRVEYAVKLPAEDDDGFIYLPIDAKFPGDTYLALREAADSGDKERTAECEKMLLQTIRNEARDIHDKYLDPPYTTDFAIMFLPFEGLYSEVVNRGMVEELQRKYKVNIAGPSTMAALLNSLQMGFRTLAVQQRSAEVWEVLSSVRKEFDTFAETLERTQNRLDQANRELDSLVGVRTRQLQKQLSRIDNQ